MRGRPRFVYRWQSTLMCWETYHTVAIVHSQVLQGGDYVAILNPVYPTARVGYGIVSPITLFRGRPLQEYYIEVEVKRVEVDVPLVMDNLDCGQTTLLHTFGSTVVWLKLLVINIGDGY